MMSSVSIMSTIELLLLFLHNYPLIILTITFRTTIKVPSRCHYYASFHGYKDIYSYDEHYDIVLSLFWLLGRFVEILLLSNT